MTREAKWAFKDKKDAENFIKRNGGEPANFDETNKAANESRCADTLMIREKRITHKDSAEP